MKLLHIKVVSAPTCGGLLDGLDVFFNSDSEENDIIFSPICLIGPNGSGKSQFLQIIAEIFQAIFNKFLPAEERLESNPKLLFEIEYKIIPLGENKYRHIKIVRERTKRKLELKILEKQGKEWITLNDDNDSIHALLPSKIIGYTSGTNETLSFPFLVSRSGYAEEVGKSALSDELSDKSIPDTRLMLIDYGTNLEVLVANMLLGSKEQIAYQLKESKLSNIYSFRCIIQLAHGAAPQIAKSARKENIRKKIQLTNELEEYIEFMKRSSTCYEYEEKAEKYIFDVLVNDETRKAFKHFWKTSLNLYSSFHKLSMLNDLAISRGTRERFKHETLTRRFASRLPEPQDEDKVFRFERVEFFNAVGDSIVDYVSLSDGEHQLAQILGVFGMVTNPNIIFLLDEPESHYNPQWRVQFISKLYDNPTLLGSRKKSNTLINQQECLLTTHAPFVPSDMDRKNVMIFNKTDNGIEVIHPDIQTYGSTFDDILGACFEVKPPISALSQSEVEKLSKSNDPKVIRKKIDELGFSVEKLLLVDHLRQLEKKEK